MAGEPINRFLKSGLSELVSATMLDTAREDAFHITRLGISATLTAGVRSDIWEGTGQIVYPSAAGIASVVSTDANDTILGSGARLVQIVGLDANYDEVIEVVPLNGLSPVNTANEYLRLQDVTVISTGTTFAANTGAISVSIGGNDQLCIAAGGGVSRNSHYTVPNNFTFFLFDTIISVYSPTGSGGKSSEVRFDFIGPSPGFIHYNTFEIGISATANTTATQVTPTLFPSKYSFHVSALTADNNVRVSIIQNGLCVNNKYINNLPAAFRTV